MIVERENNEILVRFKAGNKASEIQSILDYFRYVELSGKSESKQKDLDLLLKEAKKGRLNKIKKEINLDD